ncbi:KDM1B [Symbiodinium pilosum]|uniref:KDM1B protein n=1 Tax=Symbiodinium pilosum TaxID=2952 RepID=A0A812YJP3_SYMPI|nr:KDM1B [Symbiodinium pilosum]
MGRMRQLPISLHCCAKLTAAAVTVSCILGFTCWASTEASESTRPPSFLQMAQASRIAGRHEQQKARSKHPSSLLACPAELQRRNPDCRVVKVRGNFRVGNKSIRPTVLHSTMVWTAVDASLLTDHDSIVGWKPAMEDVKSRCPGETKQVSLVHHINIYAYDAKTPLTDGRTYVVGERGGPVDETSFRMLASHDKEAGDYVLPFGYGIPLGKQALMERHVLFPKCWDFQEDVVESSGMDLYVVSSRSMKPAALVGALNFNMDVQPKQGPVEWITRMSVEKLRGFVSKNGNEWPEILAVHLHTHDVAQVKYFEILNNDGSVAFQSQKEKAGYGLKEQSFANLPEIGWPRLQLRAGQQLLQHCMFNSDKLDAHVEYGLDWGQEMCAPLLVVGGSGVRPMPSLLSSMDGYLSRMHGMWADVVDDIKRLLSEH